MKRSADNLIFSIPQYYRITLVLVNFSIRNSCNLNSFQGEENGEIKKMIDSANSDSEDDRESEYHD